MADMNGNTPGTFCWVELATTDQKSAVSFYRDLFGWDVNDQPMGPTETYSLFKLRGRDAAAAYTMRDEERKSGMPPHWNMYVAVKSADEAAKRAAELGGKVVAPPFDVMDAGRMAVLQDPTGAYVCVWQGGKSQGVGVKREPGALCWTELTTGDTKTAEKFYSQLFGWTAKQSAMPGMEYTEWQVNGTSEGGMMPTPKDMPNVPPNWLPYFEVRDPDATATKAKSLGANTIVPPTDIPNVGRFSIVQDPQGAVFAIFKGANAQHGG
jgi:uncharacterized protein